MKSFTILPIVYVAECSVSACSERTEKEQTEIIRRKYFVTRPASSQHDWFTIFKKNIHYNLLNFQTILS